MIIKSVRIENYRCVIDETLECDDLIVIVGPNGAGKSTFLQALNLFYSTSPSVEAEDFCGHQTNGDVIVTVTFDKLSAPALERFEKYVEDGRLTIARVFHWDGAKISDKYHGSRLHRPEFMQLRQLQLADLKTQYNGLRTSLEFASLPKVTTKGDMLGALDVWEGANPALCERRHDDGQFFGFKAVANGYLGEFTRYVLVPAVRDAALDGEEGKESLFTQLVNLVVRSDTTGDTELDALSKEVADKYKQIVTDKKEEGLQALQKEFAIALAVYVRDSDVKLTWGEMPNIQLPIPKAIAKIGEDGYFSGVERKGHGLQRVFIMTLLQLLEAVRTRSAEAQAYEGDDQRSVPDLVIGIEEPELYQHPDRQRHVAAVLGRLARISLDESPSTQVFYTTHSPHFVGLDRFDRIRLARKCPSEGALPMSTRLASLSLDVVARRLAEAANADGSKFTAQSLVGRLHSIMTPWMNEGFFTDVAVLVEGEQDRAALIGAARLGGHDFEQMGIAVIPCIGKNNIDRPALIFRGLGIATYIMFDSDAKKPEKDTPETNRRLLRIVGSAESDFPNKVEKDFACFHDKVETMLFEEVGDALLSSIINDLQQEYEVKKNDILKNPTMMTETLNRGAAAGRRSQTLDRIVARILEMREAVKPGVAVA